MSIAEYSSICRAISKRLWSTSCWNDTSKLLRRRLSVRLCIPNSAAIVLGLALTRQDRRAQYAAHLSRKVVAVALLEHPYLRLQQHAKLVVDAIQMVIQVSDREQEGVLLGVEPQRNAEKSAKRSRVRRHAVGEPGLGGPEVRAAQLPHDVEQNGDGAVTDVVDGFDPRVGDLPGEHRRMVVHHKVYGGALGVQMEIPDETVQRFTNVVRIPNEQPYEAERMQPSCWPTSSPK